MYRWSKTIAVSAATVLCAAVIAAPAQATQSRVTGGTVTISQSPQVLQFLHAHGITATALGRATLGQGSLTLPIASGRINTGKLRGVIDAAGGVKFIGGKLLKFRIVHYRIKFTRHGGTISALAAGHRVLIGRIVPHLSVSGTTATLTGTISASRAWIRYLDAWGGTNVGTPGESIGSLQATVSIG